MQSQFLKETSFVYQSNIFIIFQFVNFLIFFYQMGIDLQAQRFSTIFNHLLDKWNTGSDKQNFENQIFIILSSFLDIKIQKWQIVKI